MTTPSGLTLIYSYAGTGSTTYGPSATPPTNLGTYAVTATVSNPNYTGNGSGTLTITPAAATVNLANSTQPYTGSSITVTGTTTAFGPGARPIATRAPVRRPVRPAPRVRSMWAHTR